MLRPYLDILRELACESAIRYSLMFSFAGIEHMCYTLGKSLASGFAP